MQAVLYNFTHFLSDNSSHGMNRFKEDAQSFCEIGNLYSVTCAEKHNHCFTNDASKAKHNGGNNARQGGWDNDSERGL